MYIYTLQYTILYHSPVMMEYVYNFKVPTKKYKIHKIFKDLHSQIIGTCLCNCWHFCVTILIIQRGFVVLHRNRDIYIPDIWGVNCNMSKTGNM